MKDSVLNVYKPQGWTPFEVVKFIKDKEELADLKMSYAGKLDPMAEGVLLILTGDKTLNQEKYQNLGKEYIAEILFGFSTDSGDLLGIVNDKELNLDISKNMLQDYLKDFNGKLSLELPAFSSFEIEGKPLFWWARNEKLNEIDIPKKDMVVFKNSLLKIYEIKSDELKKEAESRVAKVDGDFRQREVLDRWEESIDKNNLDKYRLARVKFQCSSGTYIRSLVEDLSKVMKTSACLFSLVRTKVGLEEYDDKSFWAGDSIKIDNMKD